MNNIISWSKELYTQEQLRNFIKMFFLPNIILFGGVNLHIYMVSLILKEKLIMKNYLIFLR